jgi:sugar phosphate isomerase/epimerase
MKIGIQLYTVRNELQKDFDGTVKAVAGLGFDGVEMAFNYGGKSPEALEETLSSAGLECAGLYVSPSAAANPDSDERKFAAALKTPFLTVGITDKCNEKDWPDAVKLVDETARKAASAGFLLLYHNHWQEFAKIGGKYALDILFRDTDPVFVKAELDTGWIHKAGEKPVKYINSLSGRMPKLHIKDMSAQCEPTEIGEGVLNITEIVRAAHDSGVKWLIYEQDQSSVGSLKSAEISFAGIKRALKNAGL